MDAARQKLQKYMADVKKCLIDIAHASHHLDRLFDQSSQQALQGTHSGTPDDPG